jgi:hypothetical protein
VACGQERLRHAFCTHISNNADKPVLSDKPFLVKTDMKLFGYNFCRLWQGNEGKNIPTRRYCEASRLKKLSEFSSRRP